MTIDFENLIGQLRLIRGDAGLPNHQMPAL